MSALVTWLNTTTNVEWYKGEPSNEVLMRDGKGNLPCVYIWAGDSFDSMWFASKSASVAFVVRFKVFTTRYTSESEAHRQARAIAATLVSFFSQAMTADSTAVSSYQSLTNGQEVPTSAKATVDVSPSTDDAAVLGQATIELTIQHEVAV
jgi:phage gp37-like protein